MHGQPNPPRGQRDSRPNSGGGRPPQGGGRDGPQRDDRGRPQRGPERGPQRGPQAGPHAGAGAGSRSGSGPGLRDSRDPRDARDARERAAAPLAPAVLKSGVPHGATESGWLPDCVYTGEKFETGLAFFADAQGRIIRFSREPADLAAARRLAGQAALPGLVNAHSHSWQRLARGRAERRGRSEREVMDQLVARLSAEDIFDAARMVFLEMLLSGITCVGEFHYVHQAPEGASWPEPNHASREILRAAHDVGIRIALLHVAYARGDFRGEAGAAPARFRSAASEQFLREAEVLRVAVEKEFPADEAWLGVGAHSLATVPLDQVKAIAAYARAQRMRFHVHVSTTAAENAACIAEYGRTPIALLAEHGIVDKRFTAADVLHLSDDDIKALGTARAMVCVCPTAAQNSGLGAGSMDKLLASGAGVALGSDSHVQIDLLKDGRALEYQMRVAKAQRSALAADPATALFHAATVTGARSLGATTGALEVGRPADFFTINLFEPSVAGADPETLLAHVVFSLERRAIRDVWIGARQRIAGGRHVNQGPIVGRFVDLQKRLWGAAS